VSAEPIIEPSVASTDGWGTSRRVTAAAWLAFALVFALVASSVLRHDFRERSAFGDSSSFVLQAVSLGFDGHNLSYDRTDLDYFRSLHWSEEPRGAHIQRHGDGWAFAKPYGYSAYLAPFLRMFSPGTAVAVANLGLLAALAFLATMTLWLRYRGAVVPIVVGTFLFGSHLFFYAYWAWTELFLATLVAAAGYLLLRGHLQRSVWWTGAGAVAAAAVVAEKAPAVVIVAPLVLVAVWSLRGWLARSGVVAVGALAFLVAIVPFVHYSDGATWNPYGGDRYYIDGRAPFAGIEVGDDEIYPVGTSETFSLEFLRENLGEDLGSTARSAAYFVVGRHTGLLLFLPLAVAIGALSIVVVARRRRSTPPAGLAILGGLVVYSGFYVALFPQNFYGGGQSMGNRYFLQVSPMIIPLAVAMSLRARDLVVASAVSAVLAVVLLTHHYRRPEAALHEIWRTNGRQELFPYEVNQEYQGQWGPR
jgi:hypothetical protein